MRSLWKALAIAWLGGAGSPALLEVPPIVPERIMAAEEAETHDVMATAGEPQQEGPDDIEPSA